LADQRSERTFFVGKIHIPWRFLTGKREWCSEHNPDFTYCSCNQIYYRNGRVMDFGTSTTKCVISLQI